MALIFKPFKSELPTKDGEQLYYPRLVKYGKVVNTQKLGELIAEKSSVTPGDCHNVVRNLMSVMREQLLNSRTVRLDGLGTFTMIARAGGKGVKTAAEVNSAQIKGLKCQFTPEYTRAGRGGNVTRSLTEGVEYVNISELGAFSEAIDNGDGGGNGGDDGGWVDPSA